VLKRIFVSFFIAALVFVSLHTPATAQTDLAPKPDFVKRVVELVKAQGVEIYYSWFMQASMNIYSGDWLAFDPKKAKADFVEVTGVVGLEAQAKLIADTIVAWRSKNFSPTYFALLDDTAAASQPAFMLAVSAPSEGSQLCQKLIANADASKKADAGLKGYKPQEETGLSIIDLDSKATVKLDAAVIAKLQTELLTQINAERATLKLPPLTNNSTKLTQAAQMMANQLAVANNVEYYSDKDCKHYGTDGSSVRNRSDRVDYRGTTTENANLTPDLDATKAYQGWKDSSGHYANMIESRMTEVGLGVARHANGGYYWVHLFGGGEKKP
jgi:uncharacterized protein YkwD